MRKEYDFTKAKHGPVAAVGQGKTRITIRIDDDLVVWFKEQVHAAGGGSYQRLINAALREHMESKASRWRRPCGESSVRSCAGRVERRPPDDHLSRSGISLAPGHVSPSTPIQSCPFVTFVRFLVS